MKSIRPTEIESFVPTFDFGSWEKGSPESQAQLGRALVDACKSSGFVYIMNHDMPAEKMQAAFAYNRKFFGMSMEDKMKAPHPPGFAVHRGYSWPSLEKVYQVIDSEGPGKQEAKTGVDIKESFEVGSEENFDKQPNVWLPEDVLPGFRNCMLETYWAIDAMAHKLMEALALGFNLPRDHLSQYHSINNRLRLLHYPPIPKDRAGEVEGMSRLPEHADWGTITLLFQEDLGGLEVQDPNDPTRYIYVPPAARGGFIMTVGVILQRWSNGESHLPTNVYVINLPVVTARTL